RGGRAHRRRHRTTTMTMTPDEIVVLSPLVRRVLANTPSRMTVPVTNTYLVGTDDLAVIDPGPDDHEEHLDKVAEAGAGRIRWILATHTHPAPPPRAGRPEGRNRGTEPG